MKVVIINGSPRHPSNTLFIANILKERLEASKIDVEIINLYKLNAVYCKACDKCFELKNNACVYTDGTNEVIAKMIEADAIILGSPIHCGDVSALMKVVMDKVTYVSLANKGLFKNKLGASYVTVRRMGGLTGLNTLNNYLTYGQVKLVTADSWNIIYGQKVNEVALDREGISAITRTCDNLINALLNKKEEPSVKKEYLNYIRKDLTLKEI
ncbi:flavodoxin family protein [Mycoplasma sp. P36-A1]|uniref:flavodoxin family protein n=1 Tax=Mycoplasma sp. P36-A1 TaxID=3252900 RepID=UPI003C2AF8C0